MIAESTLDRFSLQDRRIVVTGASQGLGRALAIAAVEAGASVLGVARSTERLVETQRLTGAVGRFESFSADIAHIRDIDSLVERMWAHGPISGVIHAAGIQVRKPALRVTPDDWSRVTTVQLEAPFFLSCAIAARQQAAGIAGSHVLIGSLTSWVGRPDIAPYGASKAGILGLTRSLAAEWAASDIRVNALCPGYFHTALTDDLLADETRRADILRRIPMGRLGIADDLAGGAIFLLSSASAYMTGQTINIDGGWLAT